MPQGGAKPALNTERLLLALIKWAAKGAERIDRAAFTRVWALVFGGEEDEVTEEEWQGMCLLPEEERE